MKVEFGLFNWGDAIQSGTVFPADIHTSSLPVQDYLEDTDADVFDVQECFARRRLS